MKRLILAAVLALLLLCPRVLAQSGSTCGDELTWSLDDSGLLTVTGTGPMTAHPWPAQQVVRAVISEGVTAVCADAFRYGTALQSVSIPATVTVLGSGAFYGCSGLTELALPEGLTSVGSMAFQYCSGLTAVTVPAGVTAIPSDAFSGCTRLVQAALPQGLTAIGNGAFRDCAALTALPPLPALVSVGDNAFYGCAALTAFTLPEGAESVGTHAFRSCAALRRIVIPGSVAQIGASAFRGCGSLTIAGVPGSEAQRFAADSGIPFESLILTPDAVLPEDLTRIEDHAFAGIAATAVAIPEGCRFVGAGAFAGSPSLRQAALPPGLTDIAPDAFDPVVTLVVQRGSPAAAWAAAHGYAWIGR